MRGVVASYTLGTEFLRDTADLFSAKDFAALQVAMAEEDPGDASHFRFDGIINSNDVLLPNNNASDPDASHELSYDTILRLVERLGDILSKRWVRVTTARRARSLSKPG